MTLKNFEEYIDETILERVLRYYKDGHVGAVEFDGIGWVAEVAGSEDYTVTVTLDDSGSILDTECDCPYDWGEYCKHQAAVFFALRNDKSRHIYEKILVHENLKLRLLEYCKKNISAVARLYPHMLPECKTALDELFPRYIRQEAERASNRKHYHQVCGIVKHYIKACGAHSGSLIREELLEKYPRRPALADELRKVKLSFTKGT